MPNLPVRCIVVDDEPKAAEYMAGLVRKTSFLELAGTTTAPYEALGWVLEERAELVFLDLTMPELHGLQFIRMSASKCRFIVTTGFDEFALQGFELDVVDYIMKPVTYDRFLKAAGKALQILRPPASAQAQQDYSFIKCMGRQHLQKVNHQDIFYIQAVDGQSVFYTKEGKLASPTPLSELETVLPGNCFLRVHRSYIVSVGKIEMVRGNTITLQKVNIPIGLPYQEKFYRTVR